MVVEREFRTASVHQGYIEPHNATALWNADGHAHHLDAHAGLASTCAARWPSCCRFPVSQIKVVPMEIGGGFGGKIRVYLEPVAAMLSVAKRGRPVKMVMNRAEVLRRRPVRRPARSSG